MVILVGYQYAEDWDGRECCCSGELVLDDRDGKALEVSEETEKRWREVYGQWLVVKAEIESELDKVESQTRREAQHKAYPHLKWFEEHYRKLREDPSYSYPHDTVQFGGVSYSVSNRR